MFRKTKICSGLMLAFGGTLALTEFVPKALFKLGNGRCLVAGIALPFGAQFAFR